VPKTAATPGYSGTPLARKLGIQADAEVMTLNAPADYRAWLAPLPAGVRFVKRAGATTGIAHVFVKRKAELTATLGGLRTALGPEAAVWVSWPKKTSGVESEVTENLIRDVALPLGFVDVKVCAVSEVWSGLKLVVRKALRP
jgi:hypothetical protein